MMWLQHKPSIVTNYKQCICTHQENITSYYDMGVSIQLWTSQYKLYNKQVNYTRAPRQHTVLVMLWENPL